MLLTTPAEVNGVLLLEGGGGGVSQQNQSEQIKWHSAKHQVTASVHIQEKKTAAFLFASVFWSFCVSPWHSASLSASDV